MHPLTVRPSRSYSAARTIKHIYSAISRFRRKSIFLRFQTVNQPHPIVLDRNHQFKKCPYPPCPSLPTPPLTSSHPNNNTKVIDVVHIARELHWAQRGHIAG